MTDSSSKLLLGYVFNVVYLLAANFHYLSNAIFDFVRSLTSRNKLQLIAGLSLESLLFLLVFYTLKLFSRLEQ